MEKTSLPDNGNPRYKDSIAYNIVSQIASERSGLWYRAIREDDGSQIDVLVLGSLDDSEKQRIKKRIALVRQLNHPTVAQVFDVDFSGPDQSCTLEPISSRKLHDVVGEQEHQDASKILDYAYQIASAVASGHRLGLAHGRLSPETVHVRSDGSLQLDYLRPQSLQETVTGTLYDTDFQAPELAGPNEADAAADSFSVASLFIWLIGGEGAIACWDLHTFRENLISHLPEPEFDNEALDAFCSAVAEAINADPSDRGSVDEFCILLERLAKVQLATTSRRDDSDVFDQTTRFPEGSAGELASTGQFEIAVQDTKPTLSCSGSATAKQLGRFRILKKLGEGGMGAVFMAEDSSDGTLVAIKVLHNRVVSNRNAIRRFQKEARLLGEIDSPYVTNLVEVNQDHGVHYIVMEFVSGVDLQQILCTQSRMGERIALFLMADVARGLASVHERGIIHRDIKPGNILLAFDLQDQQTDLKSLEIDSAVLRRLHVKVSDFGLARQLDQSESMQMTREGIALGTPLYMSPEQFTGTQVSPASDVYSMGITLYEMLAGKPPYRSGDISQLINMHCHERPPDLRKIRSDVTDAAIEIIQRAIAKKPEDRYADASQLLRDIERVLRGEATTVEAHPHVPSFDSSKVFEEVFEFDLKGEVNKLWPHISNTDRINNAVGVPSVVYETRRDDQGRLRKFGSFRMAGLRIGWEEHPFEWIEGQRLGILREFNQGPFVWFLSIVELTPNLAGGTRLRHTVRIMPRGLVGRAVAILEVRLKGKRNLERVYRRIDRSVTGGLGISPTLDPFTEPAMLATSRLRRLEQCLDLLTERQIDPKIVECLGQFLRESPAQELGRIRPIALARNFSVDANRMIEGCLTAAQVGLLDLRWDILCPTCRISSQVAQTLKDLEDHARCEVCDIDFEVDFSQSVEMVFRVNPEIREADVGTYCIGGPEHSPHVVLQLRLLPGTRVELTPLLSEGEYVLRSAQLPYNYRLRALPGKGTATTEIVLSENSMAEPQSQVRAGRNLLTITNDYDREIVIRLERTVPITDVVTAAQASSLPMFRDLFPNESPKLGKLINVSTVTLLAIDLFDSDRLYEELDDVEAYSCVRQFQAYTEQLAAKHSAGIMKIMGTEILLVFETPLEIVNLLSALVDKLEQEGRGLQLRAAVHRGTALATSTDEQIEYFGSTVHLVRRILQQAGADKLLMTEAFAADPMVIQVVRQRNLKTRFTNITDLGRSGQRIQCVSLS